VVAVGLILIGGAIIPAFVWDHDELFWYRGDPLHTLATVLYALSVLLCLIIGCTGRLGGRSSFAEIHPGAALALALVVAAPAIILLLRNYWMLMTDLYLLNLLFISLILWFPDWVRASFPSVGKHGWEILVFALGLMGVSAILVIREVIQLARVSDQAETQRVRFGY
jgi:hypothetical protein